MVSSFSHFAPKCISKCLWQRGFESGLLMMIPRRITWAVQAAASSRKLPTAVLDSLHASSASCEAAIASGSGTCALFSRGEVLVWQGDAGAASQIATRTLPYAPSGQAFLSLLVDQVGRIKADACLDAALLGLSLKAHNSSV